MTRLASMEPADPVEWQAFLDEPAAYAEPLRLAACFDGAIGEAACVRLLGTARLRTRLSNLLAKHHRLPAPLDVAEIDEADRAVALASAEELREIALRAGAIYWANSFAGIIDGQKTAALHTALGEELCAFAVANRDLAGAPQPHPPAGEIRERVASDGWQCLAAWFDAVPAFVAARVRLKLPPDELVDDAPASAFAESGPRIVRRAAG